MANAASIQAGSPPWHRWGPAFNGLHAMLGFFSPAGSLGGSFLCGDFPEAMLTSDYYVSPLAVVASWVDAAMTDEAGVPAALGPIGLEGVSNFADFYWGKGYGVGPSIPNNLIKGWWYVVGDQTQFDY